MTEPKVFKLLRTLRADEFSHFQNFVEVHAQPSTNRFLQAIVELQEHYQPDWKIWTNEMLLSSFTNTVYEKAATKHGFSSHQNKVVKLYRAFIENLPQTSDEYDKYRFIAGYMLERGRISEAEDAMGKVWEAIQAMPQGPYAIKSEFEARWMGLTLANRPNNRDIPYGLEAFEHFVNEMYIVFKLKFIYVLINRSLVHRKSIPREDFNRWRKEVAHCKRIMDLRGDLMPYGRLLYDLALLTGNAYLFQAVQFGWIDRIDKKEGSSLLESWSIFEVEGGLAIRKRLDELHLSNEESVDVCGILINLFVDQYFRGISGALQSSFSIYNYLLDRQLLIAEDGTVNIFHFKNYVKIGCELGAYKMVSHMVNDYKNRLPEPEERRETLLGLVDVLVMSHQLHDNVGLTIDELSVLGFKLQTLHGTWAGNKGKDEDLFFRMSLDICRIKVGVWKIIQDDSFFGKEPIEWMFDALLAFSQKLQRHQSDLAPSIVLAYRTFADVVKGLVIEVSAPENKQGIRKEMIDKTKAAPYCTERPWLTKVIGQLL